MAARGPIGKREDEKVRRNKPDIPTLKIGASEGPVEHPPLDIPDAHPIIEDIYMAMVDANHAALYETTDWQYARFQLHFADKLLKSSRPSAQMLQTINQALGNLLLTEADRRRVHVEVHKNAAEAEVIDIAEQLRMLNQQQDAG